MSLTDLPQVLSTDESQEYYFDEGCYILELANGSHDPALSIARARVVPGTATHLHRLSATIERYYILQGTGDVTLGDNKLNAKAGDVVFIPENCPQKIRNTGEQDLIFLALCTPRFRPENYCEIE